MFLIMIIEMSICNTVGIDLTSYRIYVILLLNLKDRIKYLLSMA